MRVALFTDTFLPDVNGVAKTLGRWTRYLESRGVACKVFAPTSITNEDMDPFRVERFHSIPFLLYPECRLAIPNPVHIRKTLLNFQPTIIHCATPFNLGLFGMHYAHKNQIPLVASYHTHFDQYLSHYKIQWVESTLWRYMLWFHQNCRKIYVPSHSTKDHLEKKGLSNLEIWSRGVESERFRPYVNRQEVLSTYELDTQKFTILYVGRLALEKSMNVVFDTYDSLPEVMKRNSQLIIAGDGPLGESLREQFKDDANIIYTGFVQGKALSDLYAASDVLLFPSATETFGNVVLESMASGTPVIGAAAGGVKDNIQHGSTGLLCPPGDVPAFVKAVEQLYRSPDFSRFLAIGGREYALLQTWEQVFSRLYDSYMKVTGESMLEPQTAASMAGR
jgi:glycosyltransferase involved in cell wall biosynthesis